MTQDELLQEIAGLKKRLADFQSLESNCKQTEEDLRHAKEELEVQVWGIDKTNEAIKFLYKELEKKNKELQEIDRFKSDFINTLSHELRTPLTTIRESISQIFDGLHGPTSPAQNEFLSICLEDIDRLKRIIDNLLDISKLESGKFKIIREEVDIVDLAKKAIAEFKPQASVKNIELRERFLSGKAIVHADKYSIIRVFSNLIGNALKFTAQGFVEVSVEDKDECVECCISDTGQGIAEEDLPKLFGKFQQFARVDGPGEKGTGLGLSISKNIIELHRGKIFADSILNQGTKFIFTIPKYKTGGLYREYIAAMLKKAIRENSTLSIVIFGIKAIPLVGNSAETGRVDAFMQKLRHILKRNLRQADIVIQDPRLVMAAFPDMDKQMALAIADRIGASMKEQPPANKSESGAEFFFYLINYPDDGRSEEEIYARLDASLGK